MRSNSFGGQNHVAKINNAPLRVDPALKAEAAEVLSGVGLSLSDAVRILLTRIAKEKGLPASLTCTEEEHDRWFSAKVQAALEDARPTIEHKNVMDDAESLLASLNKDK